jgi:two-component system response regulator AtoC
MKRPLMALTPPALRALEAYDWPGNVREMENVIERSVALTDGEVIDRHDLPPNIAGTEDLAHLPIPKVPAEGVDMPGAIDSIERGMISQALEHAGGVKARAAALLGLNRTTLVEKIKRLGMTG